MSRFTSLIMLAALGFAPFAFAPASFAQTRAPAPAAATAGQIDLNSASRDALMGLDGIGEVRADAIIRARPFKVKTELVERRIIPESLYDKLADKMMVRPVPATPAPAPTPRR
jgi:competence protein ComEA